jgi:shikimate dehydrogenase
MLKTFAVIGDPIDHSLSPAIHNAAYRELGLECTYIAYKISKEQLGVEIDSLKKIKISGFNVTIPHKVNMLKFLDEVDENCKIIGATNTVINEDGYLKGFNTDMDGFLEPIKNRNITIRNSNVLLLGSGGAARAIIAGIAKEKADHVTIINRTLEHATKLKEFSINIGLSADVKTITEINKLDTNYNFIINSSSLGLKNEPNIIPPEIINEKTTVYDIVYKPVNTELIKVSKKKNAEIIYGYEMLLSQAARSFEIWLGSKAPYEVMKKAILGGFS